VTPSPAGLKATVALTHAKVMWVKVSGQDAGTGDFTVPFLPWTNIPLAGAQLDTANSSESEITIPVIAPDPSKHYQIRIYVASNVDANGASSSYATSDALQFTGFSVPQITKSFDLKIDQSTLTVSAKTDIVANLTASWVFQDQSGAKQSVGEQVSVHHQDPSVGLQFAALGAANGALPSIHIELKDPATSQEQVADFTLSVVAASANAKSVAKAASSTPDKKTLSWNEILKGGLSAALQFLTGR
jgi:hypothetical protein